MKASPTRLPLGVLLAFCALGVLNSARADLVTVNFGTATTIQNLPYVEDGFTFSTKFGSPRVIGTSLESDRYLDFSGVTSPNAGARITATAPFDLISFDLRNTAFRDWTITASSGATRIITGGTAVQTLDFSALAGWTNLTFVDIEHAALQANANLQLDNFVFNANAAPEPHSLLMLAAAGSASFVIRRRRQPTAQT